MERTGTARNLVAATAASIVLAACSGAKAATADPGNDVHCFALAMGFRINTDLQKSPRSQRRAAKVIEAWYAGPFDRFVSAHGAGRAQLEVAPVVSALDADPAGLKGAYRACAERAIADPAFNRFAAARR